MSIGSAQLNALPGQIDQLRRIVKLQGDTLGVLLTALSQSAAFSTEERQKLAALMSGLSSPKK